MKLYINLHPPLHVVQWHQAVLHAPLEHMLQLVIDLPSFILIQLVKVVYGLVILVEILKSGI